MMNLPILHQDDDLVIINKPSGLLVHRTDIARHDSTSAMQILRDQLGQLVYPVHRLDRGASGALIFALSAEMAKLMTLQLTNGLVQKIYWAVVRGVPETSVRIDYPLKFLRDTKTDQRARMDKPAQPAVTQFDRLQTCELPVAVDRYPTSRYSLVQALPKTGRQHQIRRHLHHLGHPIIGDANYGSGKHNRFFTSAFQSKRLLLVCRSLELNHPRTEAPLKIIAPLTEDFKKLIHQLGWADVEL